MSYYKPFTLKVLFNDDTPPVLRHYDEGASVAVENMAKAINWYTAKETDCKVELRDWNNALIVDYIIKKGDQ